MSRDVIAVASDHAGVDLKSLIKEELVKAGRAVVDLGTNGPESVDYPDYADAMALAIRSGRAARGVLVCGSGIGISIAANRHPELRAALCHDVTSARMARLHNDANVIVFGARFIGSEVARDCLTTFFATPFEGGRHARRVAKLTPPNRDREKSS